jgi:pyrophosphatase PpaX
MPLTPRLLGNVSNSGRTVGETVLSIFKLEKFFDVLVTADDVMNPKPDPEPLLKAVGILRAKPSECVYVGDTSLDVACAKRAGVACVCVLNGIGKREELQGAHLIENLKGLEDAIAGIGEVKA